MGTDGVAGFNGGSIGGNGVPSDGLGGRAGNGGGASDVRQGGTDLEDRVIVAGGGGGAGRDYVNGSCVPCGTGGNGGDGGALTGLDGADPDDLIYGLYFNPGAGGKGGTPLAGGAGGVGTEGAPGNSGLLGVGGNGIDGTQSVASGGGGGGYYGGGAGAGTSSGGGVGGAGGAGGSSYIGGVTEASTTPGLRVGDGQVIITVICNELTVSVSDDVICLGESFTLDASGAGTITWDGGIVNGVAYTPTSTGTVTYSTISDDPDDCVFSVDITVFDTPVITYVTTDVVGGADGEIDVTITGGTPTYYFDWDNDGTGDFDDTEDLTGLAEGVYVLVVQDDEGCSATETIGMGYTGIESLTELDLSVFPNPTSDYFTIEGEGNYAYEVLNLNGEVLLNGSGMNQTNVSLADFANGTYLVKVKRNQIEKTLRIVKK
jgi:hypothetical protein